MAGCQTKPERPAAIRVLIERPPATLNPRMAMEAHGQRIGALIYRALTRMSPDLKAEGDLATSWSTDARGTRWTFRFRSGMQDHGGQPITAELMTRCLENYRAGTPTSRLKSAFPHWISTSAKGEIITFELNKPDPYLPNNVSLLRYFRVEGASSPCTEPGPRDTVIASGAYRPDPWVMSPDMGEKLILHPMDSALLPLQFESVMDENLKALKILRGEVDFAQLALTLSKERWLEKSHGRRVRLLVRDGVNVSYLAFNLKHPILSQREVRQAIALAIPRKEIVDGRMLGLGSVASSFLSPLLPESHPIDFPFDLAKARRMLDEAGYPATKNGIRFSLRYKTTPVRDGWETAVLIKNALREIGIDVTLDVVEPAVFFQSVDQGNFNLYSSRWIGVSDGSIFYRALRSGQPLNRVRYSDLQMDGWLEQAMSESDFTKRKAILAKVQTKMSEDLPYFPLWYWKVGTLISRDLTGLESDDLSLSGALTPITRLRLNAVPN